MPSSKQIKGKLSTVTKLHATPLSPEKKRPTSLLETSPLIDKKIFQDDFIADSFNSEVTTPANLSEKIFTINTGLLDTEPTILVSSEFKPLYRGNEKSSQGDSIQIKEDAKTITAKTALEVISQSEEIKNIAKNNKDEVIKYVDSENKFLIQLMSNLNKVFESLDISTYAIPSFNPTRNIGSLYEILRRNGYSSNDITKFSQTKLWQQSLVEVKKSLLSHSPELSSQNSLRRNSEEDLDPFNLSDVDSNSTNQKRIWMISSGSILVPEENVLLRFNEIENNVRTLVRFSERQYINLSSPGESSTSLISSYVESSRDISVIFNIFSKEYQYSKSLNDPALKELLQSKYGYSVTSDENNYMMWDYVVGRFTKKSIESVPNPTGNGNSLVSHSRQYVSLGEDNYNVLTFEKNYLPGSNSTPGSYYYVESNLNTADGENFDTQRLDDLLLRTKSAHETVGSIFQMLGYTFEQSTDVSGRNRETYRLVDDKFSLGSMTKRLDLVTQFYKKIMNINPNGSDFAGDITGIHYNKIANGQYVNPTESVNVRLAALICKAAVYPTEQYSSIALKLKSYLFILIMNVVNAQLTLPDRTYWQGDMQMSVQSGANESVINEVKERISALLASVKTRIDDKSIADASSEMRTYTFTVSEKPSGESSRISADQANYLSSITDKIFNINGMSGVWGRIVEILKEIHQESNIYNNEKTVYSSFSKTTYLFCCFDLILRIVASQTPENLSGAYSRKIEYTHTNPNYDESWSPPPMNSSVVVGASQNDVPYTKNRKITLYETGLLVSSVNLTTLNNSYFNGKFLNSNLDVTKSSKKISTSIQGYSAEQDVVVKQLSVFRRYLFDLSTSLSSFKNFLTNNFKDQIKKLTDLYALDGELQDSQKRALLNLSFSDEQIRLTRYILSEIKDRYSLTSDSNSKIKSIPQLSTIPSGSIDFFPLNDIELVSYSILSKYFQSNEFLQQKGSNKKIISVGIPPKLNRKLRATAVNSGDLTSDFKRGIVRLRVFKVDRLHSSVVYLPKTYLFDMNRYPTRILNNWDYESFLDDDFNLLRIPNKVVVNNGQILVCKDFNQSFPKDFYGQFLSRDQQLEIYSNHSKSFLCEEYLRWFTDCRFDETRYNNFSKLKSTLDNMEEQFLKYATNVRRSNTNQPAGSVTSPTVEASFIDPTSGTTFRIPVKRASSEKTNNIVESEKRIVIPMDETLKNYFFNETFFSDPLLYKKKISYPKKFDRVFSIIIDPDDFYVDESVTSRETLESLKELGVLTGGDDGSSRSVQPYKNRDTSPNDITLDEYFVTVEPFDYEPETV